MPAVDKRPRTKSIRTDKRKGTHSSLTQETLLNSLMPSSPARQRFIAAATRPFRKDTEHELAARGLLETAVIDTDGEACQAAVARWDAVDEMKLPGLWQKLLYGILALVSVVVLFHTVPTIARYKPAISGFDGVLFEDFFRPYSEVSDIPISKKLPPDDRLLVFGDLSIKSPVARMKSRWEGDPHNTAYFAEYALAHWGEHGTLPVDFLTTARRLDPDNAWFTCVAACARATNSVKARQQSKADKAAHLPVEFDIIDPVAMEDALALLSQSRDQGHFADPLPPLHRSQIQLLPMENGTEVMHAIGFTSGTRNAAIHFRPLANAIAAKAALATTAGDVACIEGLVADTRVLLARRLNEPVDTLVNELINRVIASDTIIALEQAARRSGLTEQSIALAPLLARINEASDERQKPRSEIPAVALVDKHGGRLSSFIAPPLIARQVKTPPLLTDEDVRPGRLGDHETLAWIATHLLWFFFLIAIAACFALRFREPRTLRVLSARMARLLTPRDWLLVLAGGVVLPFVWFAFITRLTSLGGRDLSLNYGRFQVWPGGDDIPVYHIQSGGLALLVLLTSGLLARLLVAKRPGISGIKWQGLLLSILAVLCATAFIPLAGYAATTSGNASIVAKYVAHGSLAISLLAFTGSWLRHLFTSPHTIFLTGRTTALHMMPPACALAALLAISAAPYFKAEALRWQARDSMIRPDGKSSCMSPFEYQVALQVRKELRETLGPSLAPPP